MSAWDDASRDPADSIPVREYDAADWNPQPREPDAHWRPIVASVDYWWRQVGTDIEIRVIPDLLSGGPAWQHEYAPTGLLTIHLAPEPVEVFEPPDPLAPIETPGPTLVRQAEWDDETQTWRTPAT